MFFRSKEEPKSEEPPKEKVKEKDMEKSHDAQSAGTEGGYDEESSPPDETEDFGEAGDAGIRVVIREKNTAELTFTGELVQKEEPTVSTGLIRVQNTGSRNRITGIDLQLDNIGDVQSEDELVESTHIGVLAPGRENDFSLNYSFEKEFEPISVEQEYYDPKTGLSPSFLGGAEKDFEAKIVITNTSEETIYDIHGEKSLNELASLQGSETTSGEISSEGTTVTFSVDEIEPQGTVEVILQLRASLPDDVPVYQAGDLKVNYEHRDKLTSGLQFVSVDGVSDFKRRIRRRQRETEPTFYDCEIFLENKSEFVYDLKKLNVYAGDLASQQMLLDWDGVQASAEERQLPPSDNVSFEFVYESLEGTPTFGDQIEFSVYSEELIASETEITVPGKELRFMAIDIAKTFLDKNDEAIDEYEIPSFVETSIATLVTLTGVGTYPLEGLQISDEIPEGFRVDNTDEVVVKRNGVVMSSDLFDVSVGSDTGDDYEDEEDQEGMEDTFAGDSLIVKFNHLEESEEEGLDKDEEISVHYVVIAERLEPREDPIRVQAHGQGFVYEDESAKVFAHSDPEAIRLVVVHRRDDVDVSKFISSLAHNGSDAYRIELEAENYGSSTVMMEIKDLIPDGFELIEGTVETEPAEGVDYEGPSNAEGGKVHGWTFTNIEPGNHIMASFMLKEISDDANPRSLQSVYKG